MTKDSRTYSTYEYYVTRGVTGDRIGPFHNSVDPLTIPRSDNYPIEYGDVTETVREYFVGQGVNVDAYGRQRPGVVTKLGPKRITVRFISNVASGTTRERPFHPHQVAPAGEDVPGVIHR